MGVKNPQIVEIHDVVVRSEALRKQLESTALLIIQWSDPYTSKLYGGKVFEYLGARRPIIAITNREGLLRSLIEKTNAGYACSDKSEVKSALREMIDEFKKTGRLEFKGIESEISKYTWDKSAKELASVLDDVSL
ncbi:MAG: hypothetical protein H5T74_14290 [Actinobacteria bacterium]|nr:hypothetical protein [Actinomycetota bacterium]